MQTQTFSVRHHAALDRLVLFEYRLTTRTGLHVGAGKSASLVGSDLPVMRDAAGRPIIPGSSLRGILRAGLEALVGSLRLDRIVQRDTPAEPDGVPAKLATLWRGLGTVDRMFGWVAPSKEQDDRGQAFASRLQISDAVCREDVLIELRDGVAIARETRTAEGGGKFDLEVVPAGTAFHGRIRFKNPAHHELGLLAQALVMLDQGVLLLGGKTARGLGWMQVEVSKPRDLTAVAMLDLAARPAPGTDAFGPVEERLRHHLDQVVELVGQAAAEPRDP